MDRGMRQERRSVVRAAEPPVDKGPRQVGDFFNCLNQMVHVPFIILDAEAKPDQSWKQLPGQSGGE